MEFIVNLVQLIGGIIISIGYFPQIKQILKTKNVESYNFHSLLSVVVGVGCMEVYSVYKLFNANVIMLIITNSISLILATTVFVLFVKYKKEVIQT
jgi:MtN3 and saliva related transmembrane protein